MKQKKMESESEEIGFNRKNGFSKEKSRQTVKIDVKKKNEGIWKRNKRNKDASI